MPSSQHVAKLEEGARAWNAWRRQNPGVAPQLSDLSLSVGHIQFGSVQGGPIDLSQADLRRAALGHATLVDADLTGAALVEADLSYARMTRAHLRGADLSHARFDHTDLMDAQLSDADLSGAQMRDARHLTQRQIEQARGDASTALPAGLIMPAAWRKEKKARSCQLARRLNSGIDDLEADPYAVLGVRRGASIREVRAAYLKLVKDLHPDGRPLDQVAGERLKSINKVYHELKVRDRRAAARRAERGVLGRPGALFVIGFLFSSISILSVFGGLYYSGLFGHPHQAQAPAAGPGDVTTGSLRDGKNGESREAAVVVHERDAAALARARDEADDAAWAEAERRGTSAALHRYLGRFPNGRHAQKATGDLALALTAEQALDNTYDGRDTPGMEAARLTLRQYLDVYPDGRLAGEITRKLEAIDAAGAAVLAETAAWAEAQRSSTGEAMRRYLAAYPNGVNAADAWRAIAALDAQEADRVAWAEAEQEGTKEAMRRYLDAYPTGASAVTARQKLALLELQTASQATASKDEADWLIAQRRNTKASYAAYVGAHPEGRHAKAARSHMAALEGSAPNSGAVAGTGNLKREKQALRKGAVDAPASQRWQSADEPFIGADGRIRQ